MCYQKCDLWITYKTTNIAGLSVTNAPLSIFMII
nr:MAG TPA: hypothetical protein [Caudoviricetes sp.]